jgi:type IV pilus assembly protein PilN
VIRINLLPYREQRRKAQLKRDGIGAGIFLLLVVGLLGLFYMHLQGVEQRHETRVEYMEDALAKIKDQLDEVNELKDKREALVAKLEVVKKLQSGRDLPVRIFRTLGQAVPKEVSLSSMRQKDGGLQLQGTARSNNVISSFMRRLEASELFRDPDLQVITNQGKGGQTLKSFKMGVKLARTGQKAENGKEGG